MATKAKTKSEITYLDDDYNVVAKDKATTAIIREINAKGQLVRETWGTWDEEAKGEKRGALVEPKGKPLKPFTEAKVPISEEDIDAAVATWNERMPKEAKGILEARVPTAEEEAEAERDLEEAGEET